MKINKKLADNNNLIYDGSWNAEMYSDKNVTLENGRSISFSPKEIEGNIIEDIFLVLDAKDKMRIIEEGNFSNSPPKYLKALMKEDDYKSLVYRYYGSEYHIGLQYLIIDSLLLVFTFGEKQPSRGVIILEGVWELSS